MPSDVVLVVPTALVSGAQKLGQPVPLSNLVVDENRSRSQPAQAKMPARCSFSSGLVNGRSVALLAQHRILVGRQQLAPFRVAVRDLERLSRGWPEPHAKDCRQRDRAGAHHQPTPGNHPALLIRCRIGIGPAYQNPWVGLPSGRHCKAFTSSAGAGGSPHPRARRARLRAAHCHLTHAHRPESSSRLRKGRGKRYILWDTTFQPAGWRRTSRPKCAVI